MSTSLQLIPVRKIRMNHTFYRKDMMSPLFVKAILLSILVIAPLLFGSVYGWSYGLWEAGIIAAFLIWLWSRSGPLISTGAQKWYWLSLGCFVIWAGLQLVPLPVNVVKFVAPPNPAFWQLDLIPPEIQRPHGLIPITLYPYATANQGLLFFCYMLVALLIYNLCKNSSEVIRTFSPTIMATICLAGFLVSGIHIVQTGLEAKAIYGFFKPQTSTSFTGPYVNYNHFAGYLEMAIPVGLGLLSAWLFNTKIQGPGFGQTNLNKILLLAGALIIMLAAIFMAKSRGGLIALCLVLIIQLPVILSIYSQRKFGRGTLILFAVVIITLGMAAHMTDWSKTIPRFQKLFHSHLQTNIRVELAKDVWGMSLKLPLTGSGLGTFSVAYPAHKTLTRQGIFVHAHNDYLEFLAETGWVGLLALLCFFFGVLWRGGGSIFRALSKSGSRDPELAQRALLLSGTLGGVVAILIHSLTDFNLRIPANALTFFVLCGLSLALAEYRLHQRRSRRSQNKNQISGTSTLLSKTWK